MIQWFFDALHRQCGGDYSDIRIIVVDFYAQSHLDWLDFDVLERKQKFREMCKCPNYLHVPPKPTPWNGPHRLTQNDYFAAANSRNTAICYCPDPYIVFLDDLSIPKDGWLEAVREAAKEKRIVCGSFQKVLHLCVEDGKVIGYADHPGGHDSRWSHGHDDKAVPCYPNWSFGCSFGCPIEYLLQINGIPEACDSTGIGMEDAHTGIALANNGHQLYYDRRMFTFESEELHHVEKPMLRKDKVKDGAGTFEQGIGLHPKDKGHFVVAMLAHAKRFDNYFGEEGLAGLRQRILRGEQFPTNVQPYHDFYDSQPLEEL